MKIDFRTGNECHETIAYLSGDGRLPRDVDADHREVIERALAACRFSGKPGTSVEILAPAGSEELARIVIVGVGGSPGALAYEKAGARLVNRLLTSGANSVMLRGIADPRMRAHAALGAALAGYRFDDYRTKLKEAEQPSLEYLTIAGEDEAEAEAAYAPLAAVASGVALARDLVSEPPNNLQPETYAERVRALSEDGLKVTVLDEKRMRELGMNLLLGVGQGSIRESRLCVIEWQGAAKPDSRPLALVGKGVTFDTGGISIKPAAAMDEMKGDMAGSAAVVGTMRALARRKAKANVVGVIGLVENMPGGNAIRPGDIIRSASGRTVEVLNTDAEGRLVLADALWYVQEHHKPRAIVDLATLTGAIIIALGHEYAGLFSSNDRLANDLIAAGGTVGEPLWRLPLGATYDKMLNSRIADVKNISGGRAAGSITAAQFLKRFVANEFPWAHLDIASMAWRHGSGGDGGKLQNPVWATGFGVRLLDRLVADAFEK